MVGLAYEFEFRQKLGQLCSLAKPPLGRHLGCDKPRDYQGEH
jgi:hypothetical protein